MAAQSNLAMLIPAYNAAEYLPRLLDSAARQTQPFDEIWVYDDSSTDDTASIAERYGARVVHGDVNRGCSHGKNRLAAEKFMDYRRFDPECVSADTRAFTIRQQINPFCGLYRREAFLRAGGYDEDPLVLYNEDVAMHIRLAFRGLSFAADETVTVINHRRLDSMSAANGLKCIQAHYHVLRNAAALEGSGPYAADIACKLWMAVGVLTAYLDWQTADAAATLAIRLSGLSSIPAGYLFKALCHASPHLAIRSREWLIRALKPALRQGYPGWRAALR
jgi:glycosyltransferase involved in cell wall biosynthesis